MTSSSGRACADPNGDYSGASYVVFGGAGVGSGGNLELLGPRRHERLQALGRRGR